MTVDFRELEVRNALSIILYLHKSGPVQKTDLYKNVSYSSTMPSKLEFLEREGFIKMDRIKFKNNTTYVELTDKGKAVAVHLQKAESAIEETL